MTHRKSVTRYQYGTLTSDKSKRFNAVFKHILKLYGRNIIIISVHFVLWCLILTKSLQLLN